MNLTTTSSAVTMTSMEISGLVESRHDKVKQSIERLAERGVIALPPAGEVSNDGPGPKVISVYKLGKRDSLIVVAQLCPEFTAKIVDRWQELEAKQSIDPIKALSDPAFMRSLLLSYTEKVIELESTVAAQAPKVEALARIAEADGCLGLQEAGKALQQKPNKFINWLREKGWIYRRAGSSTNLGRAEKVDAGYVTHKVRTIDLPDGGQKVCEQALITPKGLVKLSMMLNVKQPSDRAMVGGVA